VGRRVGGVPVGRIKGINSRNLRVILSLLGGVFTDGMLELRYNVARTSGKELIHGTEDHW